MSKKVTICKACKQEIARKAKFCPHCGTKNKKSILKKWWFWAIIVVLFVAIGSSGNDSDSDNTVNNGTNSNQNISSDDTNNAIDTNSGNIVNNNTNPDQNISSDDTNSTVNNKQKEPAKTEYYVGDVIEDGNTKIVFISSGDYVEENEFMQPDAGKKYIFLQFAFENTSKTSDTSISFYSFECYADGYAAEMYYGGGDDLSATLSAGRATTGCLYFEVPTDAEVIEVEYETNIFTEKKIKFIFEGEKDSGYVQQLNTTPTGDAYKVGDVVESSRLKIAYESCEEYVSDNMFIVPAEGYRFVSCRFEFENVGTSDEYISSFSFDCYADGLNCKGAYIRDDDLNATLSAGRKAKGTVTFEVPIDAEVIEVEYLSNYWTSNRVVFTVK